MSDKHYFKVFLSFSVNILHILQFIMRQNMEWWVWMNSNFYMHCIGCRKSRIPGVFGEYLVPAKYGNSTFSLRKWKTKSYVFTWSSSFPPMKHSIVLWCAAYIKNNTYWKVTRQVVQKGISKVWRPNGNGIHSPGIF